jgi:bifunctional DNase/RNase
VVKVKVDRLAVDIISGSPVLILTPEYLGDDEKILPIWIGPAELMAIASVLGGVKPPRPQTHDLLKNFTETFGIIISKVEITELKENTYYANIYMVKDGETVFLDSRPSDAIALALRTKSPIYASEDLLHMLRSGDEEEVHKSAALDDNPEELKKRLRQIDPGRFKDPEF